jgi:hypothetical protein
MDLPSSFFFKGLMEYLKFIPIILFMGGIMIALFILIDIVKHNSPKKRKK